MGAVVSRLQTNLRKHAHLRHLSTLFKLALDGSCIELVVNRKEPQRPRMSIQLILRHCGCVQDMALETVVIESKRTTTPKNKHKCLFPGIVT